MSLSKKAEESTPAIFDQQGGGDEGNSSAKLFKGVRRRKWGRWVSEIRVPKSRTRIWLGSYSSPEKAARAYDAAVYCLRGEKGKFNFPVEEIPRLPEEQRLSLTMDEVKAIAAQHAYAVPAAQPLQATEVKKEQENELKFMTRTTTAAAAHEAEAFDYKDSSDANSSMDYSFDKLLLADSNVIEEAISFWELL